MSDRCVDNTHVTPGPDKGGHARFPRLGAAVLLALLAGLWAWPVPTLADDPIFTLAWSPTEFDDTRSVAWGDYDGDGDLDLAVGNMYEPAWLYRNDGGALTVSAVWSSVENNWATSVAWGDYDGDGDPDLAVGNQYQPSRLYHNDSGMLTASAVWSSSESDGTTSVAWGDYDGDGDLDLVVGNEGWEGGQPNRLYRNDNGVLTVSAVWSSTETDATHSVAWGDYDSDGDLDLAAGNSDGPNRLYRNDGGMLTASAVWSSSESDGTTSVAWGDYDGDGDLDLAVGNWGQPNRLYRNDNGVLTASAVWSSTESDGTTSVAWGDYDGDGDLDLAVGNRYQPSHLYRNDGGVLTASAVWSSIESDHTASVAWGDYDGDGDLDLAAGNQGQPNRLYRNDHGPLATSTIWSPSEPDGTTSVAWGDHDGDGDLDLAAGNYYVQPNRLYRNDNGVLTASAVWSPTEFDDARSVAWGDYDGDGDLDLAAGNWDPPTGQLNRLYRNDNGMLTASTVWSSTEADDTSSVAWGDYDGDGDLDLAAGNYYVQPNRLYRNDNGVLTASAVWSSTETDTTYSMTWGDYDGDGDLDLAAGNSDGPNRLYRNDNGTLTASAVWSSTETDATHSVAWGDYDSDGDLDLAAGNSGGPNRLYRNDGGMLTASAVWSSSESDGTTSVAWGDYDGDGDLDLVVGNRGWEGGQPNRLYRNDGGTLTASAVWSSTETDATHSVAWGDYDSDGDLDLAAGNHYQPDRLYHNTRDARFGPAPIPVVRMARPGPPANADFYSSPHIWPGPTIPLTYTLFQRSSLPVRQVIGTYSLNGGGQWFPAVAATDTVTTNLSTSSFFTRSYSNNISNPIPDDGSVLTSPLTLTPTDPIADMDVFLNLTHTWDSNLVITLTSPFSRSVLLVNQRGGSGDNFTNTVLDDEAATPIASGSPPFTGRYRPEQVFSRFEGYPPAGVWTLSIVDVYPWADNGTLLSWGMTVTLNSGAVHTYTWDVFQSGFMGQSDNVVFRLQAIPAITNTRNGVPGPYLYGSYATDTFPFRVRGSQVRVLSGTVPISNALVYRLPAGQTSGGALYADATGEPFHTNGEGYLQGRGQINVGDQLLALVPMDWTESITWATGLTETMHLYHTNGMPMDTGLDAFTVTQPGVQTLTVSPDNSLLLFDLQVSLEWDAHNDPVYLQQLEFDLKKASQYLYDFTNGQAALGQVTVYQNAEGWMFSHVLVQSTNRLRPFAVQGGIVITPTIDPEHSDIVYDIGQIRMGSTWNRYGNPGQNLGLDWPLALAHELSHYLFFLDDTYLGLNEDGLLIPVGTCIGSVMGDMYDPSGINTEFLDASAWLTPPPKCADTLAHKTLDRSEWETIQLWYPWPEATVNPGPSMMPFDLTTVSILDPLTPTNTLEDPTFYLDYAGGEVSSSEARAFLMQDDKFVFDLGSPVGGQNRVLARGARPGDRLCVFDGPRHQYGCEVIDSTDERLSLEGDDSWTPLIQFSPVTSQTFNLKVDEVPVGLSLEARLYPEYGEGSEVIFLDEVSGVYSGTFSLSYPTTVGHVQVWVEETATETDPRREAIVAYAIGGNLGQGPASRGNGPASRGNGPASRGNGPASRGNGPASRGNGAPIVSPDGQMIFFTENPEIFREGDLYTIQGMAGLPPLPPGKKAVGPGYNLVASPSITQVITGSISFQYLGVDALVEGVDEAELTIHFWDENGWRVLATIRDSYYNLASAPNQGPGVYALLAGVTTPHIDAVIPSAATNDVTTTLLISGGYFLEPVEVALVGPASTYTLPVESVSPYTVTAVVTQGLPVREYEMIAVNRNQPGGAATSPTPGTFALYDPAEACFYDFFESGAGKWQRDGDWAIAILPSGERAMTDSPLGNYDNAIPPAISYTTSITSQVFSLDSCANPALTFRHDYVIAQVGSSQDVGRVEISTDDGATWTELASYSGGGVFGEGGVGTHDVESPEWTEVNWQDVEIDLSAYTSTVRLRFSLEVDQDVSDKGWVIDDVKVTGSGLGPLPAPVFLPLILKEE